MYLLKDLMGDVIKGRYYKEQLRKAPTPGVDYQFEVNTTNYKMGCYWLFVFESDSCDEEIVFLLKCFVFCFILVAFQLFFASVLKVLKMIERLKVGRSLDEETIVYIFTGN